MKSNTNLTFKKNPIFSKFKSERKIKLYGMSAYLKSLFNPLKYKSKHSQYDYTHKI